MPKFRISTAKKIDGIRTQVHKKDRDVRIFSRTLNDVTRSYPEIASAIAQMPGDFILDGEIVAHRGDRVLPFRYLQARLQRKTLDEELRAELPVAYMIFDILAAGDDLLIDEALVKRREQLAQAVVPSDAVRIAPFQRLGEAPVLKNSTNNSRARTERTRWHHAREGLHR